MRLVLVHTTWYLNYHETSYGMQDEFYTIYTKYKHTSRRLLGDGSSDAEKMMSQSS